KLTARLADLTLLMLTRLPSISLMHLLGGGDPTVLLAGFAATALTMLSLSGLSILNSVYAKKSRDAIILTYSAMIAYLMVSFLSLVPLVWLTGGLRPGGTIFGSPPAAVVPPAPSVDEQVAISVITGFNSG